MNIKIFGHLKTNMWTHHMENDHEGFHNDNTPLGF